MDAILICVKTFVAGGLTLFSGFGLVTLLMPVFALLFPVEMAIGLTAIVHLLNNLLKLILLGRFADRHVVLRFGSPAIVTAFMGARVLGRLSGLAPLMQYRLADHEVQVMPVKLTIATILMIFTSLQLTLKGRIFSLDKNYLPLGGIISGFFAGSPDIKVRYAASFSLIASSQRKVSSALVL